MFFFQFKLFRKDHHASNWFYKSYIYLKCYEVLKIMYLIDRYFLICNLIFGVKAIVTYLYNSLEGPDVICTACSNGLRDWIIK